MPHFGEEVGIAAATGTEAEVLSDGDMRDCQLLMQYIFNKIICREIGEFAVETEIEQNIDAHLFYQFGFDFGWGDACVGLIGLEEVSRMGLKGDDRF